MCSVWVGVWLVYGWRVVGVLPVSGWRVVGVWLVRGWCVFGLARGWRVFRVGWLCLMVGLVHA